jgi:hypothetical protein
MELREFLEKFLPDYEAKRKPIENEVNKSFKNSGINPAFKERHITDAMLQYFPEALQNFANLLCEKQREKCAGAMSVILDETGTMLMDFDFYRICDAEQPKLEDLE